MPGPLPKPNARRRNRDTFTGERKVACPKCGNSKREHSPCGHCATPGSATETSSGPPRNAVSGIPSGRWLKRTREWWDAWTRSAQTAVFEPSDWETLKALLPLVESMNREDDPLRRAKLFEAVHRAEKGLGGTHMERLRARIDAGNPGAVGSVPVSPGTPDVGRYSADAVAVLDDYRDLFE